MTEALTESLWLKAIEVYMRLSEDEPSLLRLLCLLRDIIEITDDPKVGALLNERAWFMLEATVTTIDIEQLDDENEGRRDYRRANGAPLVSDPEDPTRTLRYSRPSGYGKDLDDEEALTYWRIWKAMDGTARSKALQMEVLSTKDEDKVRKKELRNKALDKGGADDAADMGTALHAMTARAEDATDLWDFPEAYAADLEAFLKSLADYGLVSEMVEVPLVNDEYRTAGTADRVFRTTRELIAPDSSRIEIGELILGDIKTGKKLDFSLPSYAVQLALYAQGQLYDIVTERRLPTPPINQRWGILAHLPVGKAHCDLLWIDLAVGNYGAWISHEIREWRKKWKNGEYDAPPIPVPNPIEVLVAEAFDATVIGTLGRGRCRHDRRAQRVCRSAGQGSRGRTPPPGRPSCEVGPPGCRPRSKVSQMRRT